MITLIVLGAFLYLFGWTGLLFFWVCKIMDKYILKEFYAPVCTGLILLGLSLPVAIGIDLSNYLK